MDIFTTWFFAAFFIIGLVWTTLTVARWLDR
jgi:hypothetical protein